MLNLISIISGILFGIGLAISEMVNPNKVLSFLDISGNWDPSLIFVMITAILVCLPVYRKILKRDKPVIGKNFYLPNKIDIDKKLILGSSIFGIGYGLVGYCPGPAIASTLNGNLNTIIFILMMIIGIFIGKKYIK